MGHNPRFADNVTPASVAAAASGGHLGIYDGIQPAGPAVAVTGQRLLASLVVPAFAAPVITGTQCTVTANPITPVKALLTGTATWFRVLTPAGVPVFDGAAGTMGADLVLTPSAFIAAGVTVTVAGLTITGAASQNVTGTGSVAVPAPAPAPIPVVPSGYTGTEPVFTGAIEWCGYNWEPENWGTSIGQPAAANVSIDANGYLNLRISEISGVLTGAEVDSVRGDQGITGNTSTWGYGTYRWVIGTDLTTIDPTLVLGLFTYWAYGSPTTVPANEFGKGGPPGNTEIDIEFSNWSPEGSKTPGIFAQLGFYQDTGGGATSGIPATNEQTTHTLMTGSQSPVPAGHPVSTYEFTWLPGSITWSTWYSDITGLVTAPAPDSTLTMTEGHAYTYTELHGGNQFTGTVRIPATGKQQTIMNLWAQNQNANIADTTVILRSFSYIPST